MKLPEEYMHLAILEAKKSNIDVPVGALIVENDNIICVAHNMKEVLNDVSAHAEIIALKEAGRIKQNWRLENCTMYVTLEPCPMCAAAIINSRIKNVYFGAYDNLYGALGSKLNMRTVYNADINVKGGICEEECSLLLKNFWRKNG